MSEAVRKGMYLDESNELAPGGLSPIGQRIVIVCA
jgi:hypothetical protein